MAFTTPDEFRIPIYEQMMKGQTHKANMRAMKDAHLDAVMSLREKAMKVQIAEKRLPEELKKADYDLKVADAMLQNVGYTEKAVVQQMKNQMNSQLVDAEQHVVQGVARYAPMMETKKGWETAKQQLEDIGIDFKKLPKDLQTFTARTGSVAKSFASVADSHQKHRNAVSLKSMENANKLNEIDKQNIAAMERAKLQSETQLEIARIRANASLQAARDKAKIKAMKDTRLQSSDVTKLTQAEGMRDAMPLALQWLGQEIPITKEEMQEAQAGVAGQMTQYAFSEMKEEAAQRWRDYNSNPIPDQRLVPIEHELLEKHLYNAFNYVSADGKTFYNGPTKEWEADKNNWKQAWIRKAQVSEDYDLVIQKLGREPTLSELDMLAERKWRDPDKRFNSTPKNFLNEEPNVTAPGL